MKPYRLTITKDKRGDLRWRIDARNGKCIQASSEGFKRYRSCARNLAPVLALHQLPAPPAWPRLAKRITGTWRAGKFAFAVTFSTRRA
jgi:uncharacterized protein YegP (UPF0339 family)